MKCFQESTSPALDSLLIALGFPPATSLFWFSVTALIMSFCIQQFKKQQQTKQPAKYQTANRQRLVNIQPDIKETKNKYDRFKYVS